jgi:hypothetical protein
MNYEAKGYEALALEAIQIVRDTQGYESTAFNPMLTFLRAHFEPKALERIDICGDCAREKSCIIPMKHHMYRCDDLELTTTGQVLPATPAKPELGQDAMNVHTFIIDDRDAMRRQWEKLDIQWDGSRHKDVLEAFDRICALASRPADAALREATLALGPALQGRIFDKDDPLLPVIERIRSALASSPVEGERPVTETSDPAQAARWLGKTVESTNAFGDDSDWPGHWSDNNGGDDGGEWIKDPYRGKLSSVFAEGVYIDEEPVKWPIRLVEDEKEGAFQSTRPRGARRRQLPNWGRLRMNADKLATFVERVCEYGAPEGLVLCQEPECKHQAIVDKIEAALQREREEAAERASEYLNTLNAREDCTHDGLRDAILGPDPQSPAPQRDTAHNEAVRNNLATQAAQAKKLEGFPTIHDSIAFVSKLNATSMGGEAKLREAAKEMAEAVALLPASEGRILGLLPILCRLQSALEDTE